MKKFFSIFLCAIITFAFSGCALYDLLNFGVEKLPNPESQATGENKYVKEESWLSKTELNGYISATQTELGGTINESIIYNWVNTNYAFFTDEWGYNYTAKSMRRQIKLVPQDQVDEFKPYGEFYQAFNTGERNYCHSFFKDYFVDDSTSTRYDLVQDYYQNIGHFEHEFASSSVLLGLMDFAVQHLSPSTTIDKDWENGKMLYSINLSGATTAQIAPIIGFDFSILNSGELRSCMLDFSTTRVADKSLISSARLRLYFDKEFLTVSVESPLTLPTFRDVYYYYNEPAYAYHIKKLMPSNYGVPAIDCKMHITDKISGKEYNLYSLTKTMIVTTNYQGQFQYIDYRKSTIQVAEMLSESDKQEYGDYIYFARDYGNMYVQKNGTLTQLQDIKDEYFSLISLFDIELNTTPPSKCTTSYSKSGSTQTITFEVDSDYQMLYEFKIEGNEIIYFKSEATYWGTKLVDYFMDISYNPTIAIPSSVLNIEVYVS